MVPTSFWSVYSLTKMLLFRKAFVIPESSPTERIGPYGDFKFAVLPSSSPRSGSVMTLLNVNDSFVKAPAIYYRQLNMKRRLCRPPVAKVATINGGRCHRLSRLLVVGRSSGKAACRGGNSEYANLW